MEQKRCLFCDKMVHVKSKGSLLIFSDCYCAPGSSYSLEADSYEPASKLAYAVKRERFPLLSGYIREMTDCGEPVRMGMDELDTITRSPRVPVSIEAKGEKLLQYLYRHCAGPEQTFVIHQLTQSFNLTYSPNLQEFIYVIEKLKDEGWLERTGFSFKLTNAGWKHAASLVGGGKCKPCLVAISRNEAMRSEWASVIIPAIEQCGYEPKLIGPGAEDEGEETADARPLSEIPLLDENGLLIADLTLHEQDIYFAAGMAIGQEVPLLCTVHRDAASSLQVPPAQLHPIIWDSAEELADLLQQRLTGQA